MEYDLKQPPPSLILAAAAAITHNSAAMARMDLLGSLLDVDVDVVGDGAALESSSRVFSY